MELASNLALLFLVLTKPFHMSNEEQSWDFERKLRVLPVPRAYLPKALDLVAQGWSTCLKALSSYDSSCLRGISKLALEQV